MSVTKSEALTQILIHDQDKIRRFISVVLKRFNGLFERKFPRGKCVLRSMKMQCHRRVNVVIFLSSEELKHIVHIRLHMACDANQMKGAMDWRVVGR